ncbi:acyl-CoA thioesterase II [Phenylobacterium sp.]|uniref:acyl-CoA thioesterase n=1 Tax=Phenylobacterium sp. TaxID=1871053 RepID=UPI002736071C|nr:acyl-CoA thioesterase II [Phenylobacterium sp.]MDP3659273.1 acyl-CoA thioesterase II [Phenylobacterium sp.]
MTTLLKTLGEMLSLERTGEATFRGLSLEGGPPRIYGGQVVGQALVAANATVEAKVCHSLHCYYVRGGDPAVALDFEVEKVRDGGSFATRRVTARQAGQEIFTMTASYQSPETGLEHQGPMVDAPVLADIPDRPAAQQIGLMGALDVRSLDSPMFAPSASRKPTYQGWMRARRPIGDDARMHQAVLAYASDFAVMTPAMRPHAVDWRAPGVQVASLDHTVWFHRQSDFNQWHLFTIESDWAGSGRGFVRGTLHLEDGTLVASLAQEGLIRIRASKA